MSDQELTDLIVSALVKYPFRPALAGESPEAFREALIAFVEIRDFGLAHEIRLGRVQADWTPADVDAFLFERLGIRVN